MKFEEAIEQYRNGKKIIRKNGLMKAYICKDNIESGELYFQLFFNDIVAEDWEIEEEPGKTFEQAFEAFKEGKKIKRKCWQENEISYNWYLDKTNFCQLLPGDLLASDWEVISD